jgi:hypothetical protein
VPTATADPDTATAATVKAAYARLAALQHCADQGWFRYVGGRWHLGGRSSCVLRFPPPRPGGRRTTTQMYRDEVEWGLVGVGDAHGGRGGEVLEVLAAARANTPALLTLEEAADRLGILPTGFWGPTTDTVQMRITRRELYPLYGNRQAGRFFFATQIAALTAGGVHATRWAILEERLPPLIDLDDITWTPTAGPKRLPIPAGLTEADRRLAALTIGHDQGWFTYERADLSRPDGRYTLHVADAAGGVVERTVPAEGVLPYVYWLAVVRGLSRLVAYRPGLG